MCYNHGVSKLGVTGHNLQLSLGYRFETRSHHDGNGVVLGQCPEGESQVAHQSVTCSSSGRGRTNEVLEGRLHDPAWRQPCDWWPPSKGERRGVTESMMSRWRLLWKPSS